MSEYSSRLGSISPQQLQAALDHFDLGRLVAAESARTGNFGQNVFVTSTTGDYVLRGSPHYAWQFPKEQFFARLLHERTVVPVPWPYLLDPSPDIFGWSYVLMPRLPGLQLPDREVYAAIAPRDKRAIATAMGRTLARLQELTWPDSGEYALEADTIVPLRVPYGEWVVERIRTNLAEARTLSDRTTAADEAWVDAVLAQARGALQEGFAPCVVHGDFSMHNVVAASEKGNWRITGVFDLMTAYFGDGEADLSRLIAIYVDEDPALARAFAQAYLHRRPPRPGFAERFPVYMLDERLVIWTFAQRHEIVWWNKSWALREWAGRYSRWLRSSVETARVPRFADTPQ